MYRMKFLYAEWAPNGNAVGGGKFPSLGGGLRGVFAEEHLAITKHSRELEKVFQVL